MSKIINSHGYVKPITNIVIDRILEDGTIQHIDHELEYGNTYKFLVFSHTDGMMYSIIGKFKTFGKYPNNIKKDAIDWIEVDTSTENNSKIIRIMVDCIKCIELIEEFR